MFKRFVQFNRRILPIAVILLIVATILLPKYPLPQGSDVAGTYIKRRYDDLINLAIAAIWFFGFWWAKRSFFKNTLHQTLFFFWFVGAVSVITGLLITHAINLNLGLLHYFRRLEYMVFFFVGVAATSNLKAALRYIATAIGAGVLACLYGMGQVFFQWCSISTTNREFSKGICIPLTPGARPNATFGNQAELAVFLNLVTPYCINLFFAVKTRLMHIVLGVAFVVCMAMLVLSQARLPFVVGVLLVVALLWINGKRFFVVVFLIVTILAVMVLGKSLITRLQTTGETIFKPKPVPQVVLQIPIEQFIQEVTVPGQAYSGSAIPGQDELLDEDAYKREHGLKGVIKPDPELETKLSGGIRFDAEWPRAVQAFYRNPLVGSGYSALGIATDNDYLRSLGEVGLIGTFAFACIIIVLIRKTLRYYQQTKKKTIERAFGLSFLAVLVIMLINAIFIDVFEASKVAVLFWLLCGVAVGVFDNTEDSQAHSFGTRIKDQELRV